MNRLFFALFISCSLFYSTALFTASQEDIFTKFQNIYFVESGTYGDEGVYRALNAGFQHIYSIELSQSHYENCKKRFSDNPAATIIHGDSEHVLYNVIKDINAPITFWLDGHYCGVGTAKGNSNSPILAELEQIKKHHIKNHTILIDDARYFGTADFNYVTREQVIEKILEIKPNYTIFYINGEHENNILVALE